MSTPLISVIIPVYNRETTIGATLASVRSQRFRDFETIVVDDGSSDQTCQVVSRFPGVRLQRQQNAGPGAARNRGVAIAKGEYIAFLDSDDVWFPWTLSTFAKVIDQHESPSLISAAITEFQSDHELGEVIEQPTQCLVFDDFFVAQRSASGHFIGAGMTVVKKSAFIRVGGFADEIINCEDHDFVLRLGTDSKFVKIVTPVTVAWRQHESSTTRDLSRTLAGVRFLIRGERSGRYPGGQARRTERLIFLTARVRPVILACVNQRQIRDSFSLYRSVFADHVKLRRWRFLIGYWLCLGLLIVPRSGRSNAD